MNHQFVSLQQIARAALPVLRDNLVFPALIHTDFSDCALQCGDTVQVHKPSVFTAAEFDPDTGVTPQSFSETSIPVTLDKIATVDVEVSALELMNNLSDMETQFIAPAAAALAEKINADGLSLYKDIPYVFGTAGTPVDSLEDLADVRRVLNENKVPTAGRRAIWGTAADAALTKVSSIVNAEKTGDNTALREGSIGRVLGMDHFMSQAIPKHTAGDLKGTITVKSQTDNLSQVTLTGAAGGKLRRGDVLTINNQTYTVTADAAPAGADVTVNIYPNLTAKAGAAVTLTGSHEANLVFHPMAFAYITRPLPAPAGTTSYVTSYDGLTLRVTRGYDMQFKKEMISMDVLYGFKTLYPELALRVLG